MLLFLSLFLFALLFVSNTFFFFFCFSFFFFKKNTKENSHIFILLFIQRIQLLLQFTYARFLTSTFRKPQNNNAPNMQHRFTHKRTETTLVFATQPSQPRVRTTLPWPARPCLQNNCLFAEIPPAPHNRAPFSPFAFRHHPPTSPPDLLSMARVAIPNPARLARLPLLGSGASPGLVLVWSWFGPGRG